MFGKVFEFGLVLLHILWQPTWEFTEFTEKTLQTYKQSKETSSKFMKVYISVIYTVDLNKWLFYHPKTVQWADDEQTFWMALCQTWNFISVIAYQIHLTASCASHRCLSRNSVTWIMFPKSFILHEIKFYVFTSLQFKFASNPQNLNLAVKFFTSVHSPLTTISSLDTSLPHFSQQLPSWPQKRALREAPLRSSTDSACIGAGLILNDIPSGL